jgi:hypothetical protein
MRGIPPSKPRFPRPGGGDKRPSRTRRRHALLAGLVALVVGGAAALLAQIDGLFTRPPAMPESEAQVYGGTIQLAASGANFCRRLSFDNRTGEMLDRGIGRCRPAGTPLDASEERRPTGSNLDQIRDGFFRR